MRMMFAALFVLAATAAGARAEPVSSVSVAYNVDVGPLTMTVVKYRLELSGETARSRAQIRSSGLTSVFAEYTARAEGEAKAQAEGVAPVRFSLVREKDDRKKETTLNWASAGELSYAPQEKKAERRERIANALSGEVSDPMTAVLKIGTAGENPCPSSHVIFDGRDVFELAFIDKGSGSIDVGGYRGAVRHCGVSWTPIAGRAAERNEPRDSYEASFAPVGELPSGHTLWLPVALSGKLKGLPFKAYVTKLKPEKPGAQALTQE